MVKNFRNQQKIKDEQINFLLGDLEKNLEQYRESLENKEKQLEEAKRILIAAKTDLDLETEEIEEKTQVKKPKRKNKSSSSNVFKYINQNAKRHK